MADQTNTDTGTIQDTGGTLLTSGAADSAPASDPGQGGAAPDAGQDPKGQTDPKAGEGSEPKKDEAAGDKPAPKAPEQYEFKMPEGVTMDQKQIEAFTPLAKKLDLDNAQAQELVDFYANAQKAASEQAMTAWTTQVNTWKDETKNDPEIGGKNLEASLNAGKAFLKQFGDDQVIKVLDQYGLGNNPAIVRLLAKAGKAMGEDKFHSGSTSAADEDSPEAKAHRMFPKSLGNK